MKKRNNYWLIAGIINFGVALIHTIGGQIDLVNPMMESNLSDQVKTEFLGVWHIATVILFATAGVLLYYGVKPHKSKNELVSFINLNYVLFSLVFIVCSLYAGVLAPQWILLLPIGILGWLGTRSAKK